MEGKIIDYESRVFNELDLRFGPMMTFSPIKLAILINSIYLVSKLEKKRSFYFVQKISTFINYIVNFDIYR